MRKLARFSILGLFLFLAVLGPLHAQPAPPDANAAVNPSSSGHAPDDMTRKITELVHAEKYAEAQQLTAGLLVVYPNDQRLIKAKALIDRLLAGPANAAPGSSQPAPPAVNTNAEPLTGMDKVDYNALIELARQAQQAIDPLEQKKLLQQFMEQSSVFLQKHPDQMLLLQLRAASAISLNDPMAGYEAGQTLLTMGAADSDDSNLQRLLGQLKNKGWLDKESVEKAKVLKNTISVAFTGDAADEGIARGKGGVARGDGGGNLSINLRSKIERDVTARLQARFPHAFIHINTPEAGDPAVMVIINLHDTAWAPNCGLWWTCSPTVDSQLLISVSTPSGPLVDRSFGIHIERTVSTTFGGNFYDRLVAPVLPDWIAQAVLERVRGVLDEGVVSASLLNPTPEPAVPEARSSPPIVNSTPEPAIPEARSFAPMNNPTPKPAVLAVPGVSAPINNPVPVSATAPASGTAILHVYRLHHLTGATLKPYLNVDGKQVAKVANAQSVRMELPPGKHNISMTERRAKADLPIYDLDMAGGKEYWIRADFSAGLINHLRLYVVPSDQAQSESTRMEEIRIGDLSIN